MATLDNQIAIHLKHQEKTIFTCSYETFAFKMIPLGLCNAPGIFQRCMSIVSDVMEDDMQIFMDDFLVFRSIFNLYLETLDKVL